MTTTPHIYDYWIAADGQMGLVTDDSPAPSGAALYAEPVWHDLPDALRETVPEPVPDSLSPYQLRMGLLAIDKLAAVPAAIAAMPDDQRAAAEIAWEHAPHFPRDHSMLAGLAQAIGLTDKDVDDLFRQAAAI